MKVVTKNISVNIFVSNIEVLIKLSEKSRLLLKKFEAVVNHFNGVGKFLIVVIPVLYLNCRGLKLDLVLLQILSLKFQNLL